MIRLQTDALLSLIIVIRQLILDCPWTNNAVGALNHRYFMAFTISLLIGAFIFVKIAFTYLSMQRGIPASYPFPLRGCLFGINTCAYLVSRCTYCRCMIFGRFLSHVTSHST